MKKSSFFTLLIIAVVLSFFVTPLGDYSKELLNRIFATSPTIIDEENSGKIDNYSWKLKDSEWNSLNFEKSKGKVVFINFWASWHLPSRAQMKDISDLYNRYHNQVDFYIITNEEQEPVETFMTRNNYTFPVTYQIIGEPSPIELLKPPGCYIIDKEGRIRVHQNDVSDWNNEEVDELLTELLSK